VLRWLGLRRLQGQLQGQLLLLLLLLLLDM
jgi:hypothetical protein